MTCPAFGGADRITGTEMSRIDIARCHSAVSRQETEVTETPTRPTEIPAEWPTFHLAHPGDDPADPYDPQAPFFWAGRYHFHYVYASDDGLAWAHVSSPDLVHWTWHPTVLTPSSTGHPLFSGSGIMTKEGRPAIIFGSAGPARIAHALDDDLDSWSSPLAVEPPMRSDMDPESVAPWDPHCWLEGDTYYAIFGAPSRGVLAETGKLAALDKSGVQATVLKSPDLESWEYVGPLLSRDLPEAEHDSDISCPDFFPLGREHMLLCISHNLGCRYYLGEWNGEQFTPTRHGRMNWQLTPHLFEWGVQPPPSRNGGRAAFFAPETMLAPDGRRLMWAWCWVDGMQKGIQSIPRELSLPDDGILRMAPLRELEMLRSDEVRVAGLEVTPTEVSVVDGVAGDALECAITIRYGSARRFGAVVLCDSDGGGGLSIAVDTVAETLTVGGAEAPFTPDPESVTLRVFIDKAMVEVFADDRQAVIGTQTYRPDDVHVGLFADDRVLVDVAAWRLNSIYADEASTATEDELEIASSSTE
jgi:beta-fructofuranosidase